MPNVDTYFSLSLFLSLSLSISRVLFLSVFFILTARLLHLFVRHISFHLEVLSFVSPLR